MNKKLPDAMPSDKSLIWSQARESGLYESLLRYPAEDGNVAVVKKFMRST